MKTLDEIAIEHGTDKATVFTRTYAKPHGYTIHLATHFQPMRLLPIKLLEIGVGGGESIRTWLEYFPNARVFGVDNVHSTNPWNTPKESPDDRYTFIQGPQEDPVFWACFLADHHGDWDVVIDDGGHFSEQIIPSFNCLWPFVKAGGLYTIEDLNTAYAGAPFTNPNVQNHMDFIKDMLDSINRNQREICSLHFYRELVVIKRQ